MFAAIDLYGPAHIGILVVLIVITLLVIRNCRLGEHLPQSRASLGLLTFCCFAAYPINQMALLSCGTQITLDAIIPLHLCDIAAFICGFALITRKPLLCELAYFWGLAGTLQGLLTPDLAYGFPHPIFFTFFLQHGVVVITAIILPMGLGWRPTKGAVRRTFILLLSYAAVAMTANYILDTNYGFLKSKPSEASLLDLMPSWPWYIPLLVGLAMLIFVLLSLPFRNDNQN